MKCKFLFYAILLYPVLSGAQQMQILSVTKAGIRGTAKPESVINIDIDGDGLSDENVTADSGGNFGHKFTATVADGAKIQIWSVTKRRHFLGKEYDEPTASVVVEVGKAVIPKVNMNETIYTNATILTTNFNIPVARFDFVTDDDESTAIGNINLFTSVGAGFGINWGEKKSVYDNKGDIVSEDFKNYFGINAGLLFSAQSGEDKKNVFAPTLNLTALDFQVGGGYELGTLQAGQSRFFVTFSYSIPLYKLTRTGFLTIRERDKRNLGATNFAIGQSSTASLSGQSNSDANKVLAQQQDLQKAMFEEIDKLSKAVERLSAGPGDEDTTEIDDLKRKIEKYKELLNKQMPPEAVLELYKQENSNLPSTKSSHNSSFSQGF